ncbi:arylsulfatase [Actomonas aquatica]|uniref:Arylsulfatase n=1 Tax=Actomonas aquatica TaxID=2866162 RepID=A0ABZ1C835_9BACT|nr:arylsulfatase [Opitutus sp. WL0086]WRQ86709.1 arylsulfatase [Opitutus sp. WL0086]
MAVAAVLALSTLAVAAAADRPNIIFVMADDLGYGDLGCYGQELIATPRLDQMAAEGMRFTQFYAGASVCAPSRAVLMTGQHTGHVSVRGNASKEIQRLGDDDVTVGAVLQDAGYDTALIGKWGLGEADTTSHPNDKGFDHFFGFTNQTQAHNYYPVYLWRQRVQVPLRNEVQVAKRAGSNYHGGYAIKRVDYSHDLFFDDALAWISEPRDEPFFLYLSPTIPHANNEATNDLGDGQEVPDYGDYADRDWPTPAKGQAAMISRLDRDVGRLLDRLAELGLDENTIVFFTSDNGPHDEGGFDIRRFRPAGPLRGIKRDLYEGGIREPLIARWPGRIPAGTVNDHIGYFGDVLATCADLAGVEPPAGLDSISMVPTLLGEADATQAKHDYLYWEFYEQGGKQAIRRGDWKLVRRGLFEGPLELYNLADDIGETTNLIAEHPAVAAELEELMQAAHRPDPRWQVRGTPPPPPPPPPAAQ